MAGGIIAGQLAPANNANQNQLVNQCTNAQTTRSCVTASIQMRLSAGIAFYGLIGLPQDHLGRGGTALEARCAQGPTKCLPIPLLLLSTSNGHKTARTKCKHTESG